jgi:hypothetical protein
MLHGVIAIFKLAKPHYGRRHEILISSKEMYIKTVYELEKDGIGARLLILMYKMRGIGLQREYRTI